MDVELLNLIETIEQLRKSDSRYFAEIEFDGIKFELRIRKKVTYEFLETITIEDLKRSRTTIDSLIKLINKYF